MNSKDYDSAYLSINYLESEVKRILLERYGLENVFVVDAFNEDFSHINFDEVVEVVLFGSFARAILESGNLPFKKIRFWCLSSSVKKILENLLNIPSNYIGLLNREDFKSNTSQYELDPNKTFTFIYGGRLSPVKNIAQLILTTHILQTKYELPVELMLIGEYDNQEKIFVKSEPTNNYKQEIENLIENLEWKSKPRLSPIRPQNEWINVDVEQPIFISLSTNIFEDFGVSVLQAEQAGWPVIISDWGGHKEVLGSNILKIPFDMISQMNEDKIKSHLLASFLNIEIKKIKKLDNFQSTNVIDNTLPLVLEINQLDEIRRELFKVNGHQLNLVAREKWNEFILTKNGIKFFSKYQSYFVGDSSLQYDVAIVSDFFNNPILSKRIDDYFVNKIEELAKQKRGLIFLSILEVSQKSNWSLILNALNIHYLVETDKLDKTKQALQSIIDIEKFHTFA